VKLEKHLKIDDTNKSAVDALQESLGLPRQSIKQAMTKGAVWLTRNNGTQRIRRADKLLKAGDELHIYFDSTVLDKRPEDAVLIADEGPYSIWYKPYGVLCQGSKWGDHCTINRWAEKNLKPQRPAFIVHRLDRAATGLIIIAHQKTMATYFSNLFQSRAIEKIYQAIVWGEFPNELTLTSDIQNKSALSHAKRLSYNPESNQSLVSVTIETGRKHQIRRHLSEAHFPIVGDRLYGQSSTYTSNLCLSSTYLAFISPIDGATKSYQLPDHLRLLFPH